MDDFDSVTMQQSFDWNEKNDVLIENNEIEPMPLTFSNIPAEMPGVELESHHTQLELTVALEEPEAPTMEERATAAQCQLVDQERWRCSKMAESQEWGMEQSKHHCQYEYYTSSLR